MQGRVKGDNRLTGRTTRMLAAAVACALENGHAYVIIPRGLWQYCEPILKDFGATSVNHSRYTAHFGSDTIYFFNQHSDIVKKDGSFEVRGIKSELVFWDHEAIRQCHNHIIMRYHEYD